MPFARSNTETEQVDQANQKRPTKPGNSRIWNIHKTSFHRHYEICGSENEPNFYAEIHSLSTYKPDIILRRGSNSDGQPVAACKFLKFDSTYKVCLGDPSDPVHSQWEDMTKESFTGSQYRLEITLGNDDNQSFERRGFVWKRTRNTAVDNYSVPYLSSRNYKLIDNLTGDVLAVFTSERTFRKCGVLQIKADYGYDFERMVVVTCISLYEKARRRNQRGAGGGGGR